MGKEYWKFLCMGSKNLVFKFNYLAKWIDLSIPKVPPLLASFAVVIELRVRVGLRRLGNLHMI